MPEPAEARVSISPPDGLQSGGIEPAMLSGIPLPEDITKQMPEDRLTDYLYPLSRVNLLCGPNNAGKSRLLRASFRGASGKVPDLVPDRPRTPALTREEVSQIEQIQNILFTRRYGGDLLSDPQYQFLFHGATGLPSAQAGDAWEFLSRFIRARGVMERVLDAFSSRGGGPEYRNNLNNCLASQRQSHAMPLCAYVPTVRTCREVVDNQTLLASLSKDYFPGGLTGSLGLPDAVFQGTDMFGRIFDCLVGVPTQRRRVARFEDFLSRWFFGGRLVSLSPRHRGRTRESLHIRVEPEPERPVAELGDGLQHIIIQLAPLFLLEGENLCLFIEEPELYLHPGYQRRLIQAFLSEDAQGPWKSVQVFAATHSNHMLDMTLDHSEISIFRVHKSLEYDPSTEPDRDTVEKASVLHIDHVSGPERHLLEDLGVMDSSVFLTNCSIWVEGPHDRTIIRQYLQLHIDEGDLRGFQEDLHYSFVFYGGSLLARWNWLDEDGPDAERLCGNIFLVADRDDQQKRAKRRERLEAVMGARFLTLPCREIENSVSMPVLRKIIAGDQKIDVGSLKEIAQALLSDCKMGDVIAAMLPGGAEPQPRYGGVGETIGNKDWFARELVSNTTMLADMSPSALDLAERVYNFIASKNSDIPVAFAGDARPA